MLKEPAEGLGGLEDPQVPPLRVLCLFSAVSYQVFVGEPCNFLLESKLHLSLWRELQGLQESLLLFLHLFFHRLHLVLQSFHLLLMLSSLILELCFQQPEKRTKAIRDLFRYRGGIHRLS